jgi:hypothetical protein
MASHKGQPQRWAGTNARPQNGGYGKNNLYIFLDQTEFVWNSYYSTNERQLGCDVAVSPEASSLDLRAVCVYTDLDLQSNNCNPSLSYMSLSFRAGDMCPPCLRGVLLANGLLPGKDHVG